MHCCEPFQLFIFCEAISKDERFVEIVFKFHHYSRYLCNINEIAKIRNIKFLSEFPNKGYLSEISSPSRLWLQFDDEEFLKLDEDINEYFDANQHSRALWIDESTLYIGMKIATFICGKWHRATVLDELRKGGNICCKLRH